jgi:predicted nucleotidyltransferase component of viral defense system
MGQDLLTREQKQILEFISKDKITTPQFYLTGGTALSYFYFKHRFSEDLDFFSETEFDSKVLLSEISKIGDAIKAIKIEQQTLSGQEIFYFYFGDETKVKVDFDYFPFLPLGKFIKHNDLKVASVGDIAINKVHAITSRKRSRDYFDLYLCMNKLGWDSKNLRKNYRLKFEIDLPVEQLATSYLNVLDADDSPLFLGNQNFEEVKQFFLKEADKLREDILK